jgi:uncharacterized protein (TIGR00730 family)
MMFDRKAVFFCSACSGIDEKYNRAAREVVRAACSKGYGIVSGGSFRGTMNVVADTACECGAPNIGVLPRFMQGLQHPHLTELFWTDTMAQRKEKMREGTSLAVALPGGVGTMDELIETLTLAKLGKYDGKIVAMNIDGFYEPLKALLNHFLKEGMVDEHTLTLISFPETVEEFASLI